MAEEEQEEVDENKRIRPRERARGQKNSNLQRFPIQSVTLRSLICRKALQLLQSDSTSVVSNSSYLTYLLKEANPVLGFQWVSIPTVFPNFEFPPHQEFLRGHPYIT